MLKGYKVINDLGDIIQKATDIVTKKLKDGDIKQEPDITSQLLATIETLMIDYQKNGIVLRTSVLSDRGANSEESKYGADFIGTLKIRLPFFSVDKGFLAQAKLIKNKNKTISKKDFNDMVEQCKKMLKITPFSYLVLYTYDGIKVLPAHSIVNAEYDSMKNLLNIENNFYLKNLRDFYKNHFECFIGDLDFDTTNIDQIYQKMTDKNLKLARLDIEIIDKNKFPDCLL